MVKFQMLNNGETMTEFMPIISIIASVVTLLFLVVIYKKVKQFETKENTEEITASLTTNIDRLDKSIKDDFSRSRSENSEHSKNQREELNNSFKLINDQLTLRLEKLTEKNEEKFDKLQDKVSSQLKEIQDNNNKKLEEMRVTVDEKLHSTLEKRLGESFSVVSTQLKEVYQGLGEMQKLATGVGDLKRVLTNVKSRGTWGEVQLEKLIEQILVPDQYAKNVKTKKSSNAIVEFAIKMPGSQDDQPVWIPVDSKFPIEDYQKLLDAQEIADLGLITEYSKAIEKRIKLQAKDIQEKYLDPPNTTDFAVMFLPIEGLYAEVLRIPDLCETVQREHRIIITGPTTFWAVLNSLQMGFRTLAIQKKSSDVWKLLGTVKTEFGKFGDVLEKTQDKLRMASDSIDSAKVRTRAIERQLKDVQELPAGDQMDLLPNGEE